MDKNRTCQNCKTSNGVMSQYLFGDTMQTIEYLKEDINNVQKQGHKTMGLMYATQQKMVQQEESVTQTLESISEKMDRVLEFKKDLNEIKRSLLRIETKSDENASTSLKNNIYLDVLIDDLNANGVTNIDKSGLGVSNFR